MPDLRMIPRCAAFLLSLCVSLSPLSAYDLYLREKVFVTDDVVRLRDLGHIKNSERAELIGEKVVIRNVQKPLYLLARDLRGRLNPGPEKADWVYGGGVWLIPVGPLLSPVALGEMLRQQIASKKGGDKFLESTRFRIDESVRIPASTKETELEFQLPRSIERLRPGPGSLVLSLIGKKSARDHSGILHRYRVGLMVLRKTRVAVARRDIHPRERLRPGDWNIEEIWNEDANIRFAPTDLTNFVVLAQIKRDGVFLDSMVKKIPAISRGQSLSLLYRRPGLELNCRSTALQKGDVGDVIGVRIVWPSGKSSRIIRARVVGDGVAVPDV